MDIEIKYTITNEEQLWTLYGVALGSLYLSPDPTGLTTPFFNNIISTLEAHLNKDLAKQAKDRIMSLVKHPESETNYHLKKVQQAVNQEFKIEDDGEPY